MKALIKHELRNMWMMILYFVIGSGIGLFTVATSIQSSYEDYLFGGYTYEMSYNFINTVSKLSIIFIIGMGLGLLALLYIQFRDNKSIGVSSFIKSLPYTNKQIYGVKLGCGILSFSIPFTIGYSALLGIALGAKDWLHIIERVSPAGEMLAVGNDLGQLALYGVLLYSVALVLYLLGFWMQYVVNPLVGSLVVSVCSVMAPWFIAITAMQYMNVLTGYTLPDRMGRYLGNVIGHLFLPAYLERSSYGYDIYMESGRESFSLYNYVDVEWMVFEIIILMLVSVLLILAIMVCNKSYRADNQEQFVSEKWAERLLKIGVTVCSMGVGVLITQGFLAGTVSTGLLPTTIAVIICGLMGYVIICKICKIGQK